MHAPPRANMTFAPLVGLGKRGPGGGVWLDRVGPAQALGLIAHTDDPGGDAGDYRVGGDVLSDDAVGADDRVIADADATQDAGAVADPNVGADLYLAGVDALLADRAVDFDHAVIEVDEHRPVGDHALLTDSHSLVSGDRALLAEHGLGTDLNHALVAADLGAVAEPDEGAELDPAAGGDLQFEAGAEEDRPIGAPAPAGGR